MNIWFGAILFSIFMTACVALLILALNTSKLAKYAILAVSGTIMIGHGLRMISQGIFNPNTCYQPNFFDLIFDWLTLLLLGFFVAWYGFLEFYIKEKKFFERYRK